MRDIRPGHARQPRANPGRRVRVLISFGALLLVAGCATQPQRKMAANGRVFDPILGVWASPRVVADGDAVPRGGGSYLTGRPYTIGGRTYVPSQNPTGYSIVGTASWYGDAFHGRRTANGEVFDKGSISAAHPTLPLPSYVRVTNLKNGRSIMVRVNDRGPYHGGRVMDVSQRVAEALDFRGEGTARVKVDYIGRAALQGSDDSRLLASLRTDGAPAQLEGIQPDNPVMVADAGENTAASPQSMQSHLSADPSRPEDDAVPPTRFDRHVFVPLPPQRPFTLGESEAAPASMQAKGGSDRLARLIAKSAPLNFVPDERRSQPLENGPFRLLDRRSTMLIKTDQSDSR